MTTLRQAARTVGWAGVVFVFALTACDADRPAERPTVPTSSAPAAKSPTTPMPEVPLRYMYARGASSEGVLVSAAGITGTGQHAVAYVPTQLGAVFATEDQVYDVIDGGPVVAIGPVLNRAVYLQVDPTLRYVVWEVRRPGGLHARALVYDTVAHRTVLDRGLVWGDRSAALRITAFGAAGLRLVHLPGWDTWTFATVSHHTLTTPGGDVVDLRSHRVQGPGASRGLRSPGLRYRASEARAGRPWQVVDLTTGREVTPAPLLDPALRSAHLTGWLDEDSFGVLTTSGTWRHSSVSASVCRVAGECRVVWQRALGPEDQGLQSSSEIG